MRRFRFLSVLFAAALALSFSACDDDTTTRADGDPEPAENGGDDAGDLGLRNEGVLTVGSNVAYAPFESFESGEQAVGFDVDVMTAIAEGLGLELNFQNNPSFDALIPSLEDGQYDAVISAMTINDERKEKIDFSDPYFEADQSLTVNIEETPDLDSADKLTGDMVIGVEKGTTGADYAEENFGDTVREIRVFDDTQGSLGDLAAGRIQAVVNDFPVSAFAAQGEFKGVIAVVERFETEEQYGIGVAKGNDALREAINEQLAELRESGEYDEIFEKWFGEAPA